MKNLATPSSIFIFVFSPFTGELCSQPIRGNDRPIGRMFPEHVERRFLDPEYSLDEYFQLGSRRKVGPIKNQLASPNASKSVREETFAQLRTGLKRHTHAHTHIHRTCTVTHTHRLTHFVVLLISVFTGWAGCNHTTDFKYWNSNLGRR